MTDVGIVKNYLDNEMSDFNKNVLNYQYVEKREKIGKNSVL